MIEATPFGLPILMIDLNTGLLTAGLTIALSEIMISVDGGTPTIATGTVDEYGVGVGNGLGQYTYTPAVGEVVAPRFTMLVSKTGYAPWPYEVEVVESAPATSADVNALPSASEILDAILEYELRPGHTIRGYLRRMDALFFGKVTGLVDTIATAFQPGGIVPEFTATQDPSNGTRAEVDVTTSETP